MPAGARTVAESDLTQPQKQLIFETMLANKYFAENIAGVSVFLPRLSGDFKRNLQKFCQQITAIHTIRSESSNLLSPSSLSAVLKEFRSFNLSQELQQILFDCLLDPLLDSFHELKVTFATLYQNDLFSGEKSQSNFQALKDAIFYVDKISWVCGMFERFKKLDSKEKKQFYFDLLIYRAAVMEDMAGLYEVLDEKNLLTPVVYDSPNIERLHNIEDGLIPHICKICCELSEVDCLNQSNLDIIFTVAKDPAATRRLFAAAKVFALLGHREEERSKAAVQGLFTHIMGDSVHDSSSSAFPKEETKGDSKGVAEEGEDLKSTPSVGLRSVLEERNKKQQQWLARLMTDAKEETPLPPSIVRIIGEYGREFNPEDEKNLKQAEEFFASRSSDRIRAHLLAAAGAGWIGTFTYYLGKAPINQNVATLCLKNAINNGQIDMMCLLIEQDRDHSFSGWLYREALLRAVELKNWLLLGRLLKGEVSLLAKSKRVQVVESDAVKIMQLALANNQPQILEALLYGPCWILLGSALSGAIKPTELEDLYNHFLRIIPQAKKKPTAPPARLSAIAVLPSSNTDNPSAGAAGEAPESGGCSIS